MTSLRLKLLNRALPIILGLPLRLVRKPTPFTRKIENLARFVLKRPRGVTYEHINLPGGPPAIWCHPNEVSDNSALLYLHGGAYMSGCAATHLPIAASLALGLKRSVLFPEYRLAPEHPFPAALDDAKAAWNYLVAQNHANIAVAGDSAGGGLTFALLHELLSLDGKTPSAVVGFSPWADLTGRSESLTRNAKTEVSLPIERIAQAAAWYAGDMALDDPRLSPVFGNFKGGPPALIQVSNVEALEDDAIRLADRLRADEVDVLLQTWEDCPHAWPIYVGRLPEADDAVARAVQFISQTFER